MTFNMAVAYARRNGRGDRKLAQATFDAALAQYRDGGFVADLAEAEQEAAIAMSRLNEE